MEIKENTNKLNTVPFKSDNGTKRISIVNIIIKIIGFTIIFTGLSLLLVLVKCGLFS
jgi:hypothetical protein